MDWQSGCCVMLRGDLLKELGGFDERFFYQFEEVDLCRRVWNAGFTDPLYSNGVNHAPGRSIGQPFSRAVCGRGVPKRIPLLLQTLWTAEAHSSIGVSCSQNSACAKLATVYSIWCDQTTR